MMKDGHLKVIIFIILSYFLQTNSSLSQPSYTLAAYSGEHGLSHSSVSSTTKDSDGFMWMATWNGLHRFDGTSFKTFKETSDRRAYLDSRRMIKIAEGAEEKLWVLTYDKQLYLFDKKTETFHSLSPEINRRAKKKVMFNHIFYVDGDHVWLGTENDGLHRVSSKNPSDQSRVFPIVSTGGHINIHILHKGMDGNIWLGTNLGLYRLHQKSGKFIIKEISEGLPEAAAISKIVENEYAIFCIVNGKSIFQISKHTNEVKRTWLSDGTINQLVVSKRGDGLFCTSESGTLSKIDSRGGDGKVIYRANQPLHGLFQDSKAVLWIEPKEGGVIRFNTATGIHAIFNSPFYHASSKTIFAGFEDPNHTVWISMRGGGFGYFDEEKQKFVYTIHDMNRKDIVLPQHIYNLFYDPEGIAWVSTENQGLVKLVIGNDSFKYTDLRKDYKSYWGEEVRSVMFDHKGLLWMGTKGGDLFVRKKNELKPAVLLNIPGKGLGGIYSLLEDRDGNIWIGTKGNGLFKAVPTSESRDRFRLSHYDKANSGLSGMEVYSIFQDGDQQLWIGTFDGGLFKSDKSNSSDTRFSRVNFRGNRDHSKGSDKIRHITSDSAGNLWIASVDGLIIFDRAGRTRFIRDHKDFKSRIGDNDIQFLHKGSAGEMWVCTAGGGITRLQGSAFGKLHIRNFSTGQGLCNDFVLSCVEDHKGFLWISTEGGLSRLDLKANKFVNVDVNDGFKRLGFAEKAIAYNSEHEVVWGTSEGALSLDLRKLGTRNLSPHIVLRNLSVNNQDWEDTDPGGSKYINIQYLNEVALSHNQNNLTLDFGVTDHRHTQHNFSYRLIGLDSVWKQNGSIQRVSFTNLNPGTYFLEIKCESDLYVEPVFRKLKIVIHPAWWDTWWAYLGYGLACTFLIFIVHRFLVALLRLKNKVSLERRLGEVKMEFFTNISHELKTPLTLILSPVKKLMSSPSLKSDEKAYAAMIQNNARLLERFVNQLLDVRRLQEKKFELRVSRFDFLQWLTSIVEIFIPLAEENKIRISILCDEPFLFVAADQEKMEIIVHNLLSNALKFSPPGSRIEIYVRENDDKTNIIVDIRDEGPGIPENECEKIFNLFYVANSGEKQMVGSSGVGLSLVQELVALHKGTVRAYNRSEGGLCVSFSFPMAAESAIAIQPDTKNDCSGEEAEPVFSAVPEEELSGISDEARQKVLIVEDNRDLQQFLRLELRAHYIIHIARDGEEGWEKIRSVQPDLIISDIMMPRVTGIQLLAQVREDQNTSHIPFILLTAKHAIESRIEGLEYGADCYITKPFDTAYLLASVKNLLIQRRRLFERIRNGANEILKPEAVVMSDKDEKFLRAVVKIVDDNLDRPDFSVDDLADRVGLGRNTFYRKFKSLANITPVEFLRDMRLEKAKLYLEAGSDNIAEVAYLVGFNDPKYFSKCFKLKFGRNPKEFAQSLSSEELS